MEPLEVRLLGPVEIASDGGVVRPTAAKVRTLLVLLALHRNQAVSSAALADRLWSGRPPQSAASVVRTYVTQLRRLLGPDRVERVGDGYLLRLRADELDVSRFESLIAAADESNLGKAAAAGLLQRALDLWRGPPFPELADDAAAQAEAALLDERRWAVLERLADIELDLGLHESVTARLESAVRQAPLREQLVSRLMVALYRSGRQADALAAFQRLRRTLSDDLGLDPSPEVRHLETAILTQEGWLDGPDRRVGNLPASLTSFVGRADEIDELVTVLDSRRLVTLTGVGGCGKTRLALEVARRSDRPDGAWLVELAPRRTGAEISAAVLDALGVDQPTEGDAASALCRALVDRNLLLIMDNCEHVAASCASLCVALLEAAPDVTILATSRSPLGARGELLRRIEPLRTPDSEDDPTVIPDIPAAHLFADRISAARGGRAPQPDEWSAIGALSRRLDGLPLAIELIAPKAAHLSIGDLAELVAKELLDAELDPGITEHHRSLSTCVQWSLALLDDEHRRLLERVCLLPGWFSVSAAAAVVDSDDRNGHDVRSGLAHLAEQSLLQAAPGRPSRYRVLETVRDVVRTTLDERDQQEGLDALVAWAASWTESVEPSLRGPDGARLLDELDAERDILHAALEHGLSQPDPTDAIRVAATMSALWAHRGYLVEGQRWLDRAVAAATSVAPALRVRLLVAAGTHVMVLGDLDGFRRHVSTALTLARASESGTEILRTLLWAAHAVRVQGDHDTARALYSEALSLSRDAQDSSSAASALAGLGDVAAATDDLEEAASLHLRSLAEFRAVGNTHGEGQALLNIADVDRQAARFAAAEAEFDAAAEVFGTIADRSCMTASREGKARIAFETGRLDDAEQLYRKAIQTRRELRQHPLVVADLVALAEVFAEAGRLTEAAAALGAAGDDEHAIARRLRDELGTRRYLQAWAEGSADRLLPSA